MSEQTIQDGLYSVPVFFGRYVCRSLGATTIKDLVKNKEISGITAKECKDIKANKPDVLILNENKEIVVFVEMKHPSEFNSDALKQLAKYQELTVAKATKAKIYVISDGNTFIWFNPLTEEHVLDENGMPVCRKINPKGLTLEQQNELSNFIDEVSVSLDDTNNQMLPKDYLDPTSLAKKTARILQNMSLSSAKNSLYTFVEMFTFKFLSDIGVLKGIYSFNSIYDIYCKQSDKDAFKQYLTTVREQLLKLFPVAPDNTTIINGRLFHTQIDEMGNPIIIDSAADCFGRLLDCFYEYEEEHGKFLYIHKDFKSKLFETFMKNSSDKDGMGQFFTPLKVVQEMVRMVDVREGMSICDPACGVGKFLLEASSKISHPFYFENGVFKKKLDLYGLEKRMEDNNDDLTTILAKSNFLIFYYDLFKNNSDSDAKIRMLSENLLGEVIKSSHTTLGTLEKLVPEKYDLILANPPYYQSAVITEASKSVHINGTNAKAYTTGGRGIEALFTEWIVKSLKKGGEANIILPDGIFTNIANDNLKKLILDTCIIESIISLPVGTFFNTPKKTYILTIRKRTDAEMGMKQASPVFAYLCSTIGETMDTYRFDIDENDLNKAVDLYTLYKSNKTHSVVLQAIDDDPRVKLLEIDKFDFSSSWDINLFWTDDEKRALGIIKQDNVMSVDDFKAFTDNIVETIREYQDTLTQMKQNVTFSDVRPAYLFTPRNGSSKYTKTYCSSHKGKYPLYSGNTEGVYDMVDTFDYDGEYLTWAKDGFAGYIMLHTGKFALTGHRGILIPTDKCVDVDMKYVRYVLEPVFRAKKKGREGDLGKNEYTTLNSDMIKKIEETIPIPVKDDGSFDLEMQKQLAMKYEQIENIKNSLASQMQSLLDITVS